MRDGEEASRRADVRTTFEKVAKGQNVTGTPRLASLIGEGVVSRLRDWLGLEYSSNISRLLPSPIPTWPTPVHASGLCGLAGEIVAAIEPHSEADPIALLMQLIVGFGNAIGRTAFFTADGQKHFGNLFAVFIGATSKSRKGTSWAQVKRVLQQADPEWSNACIKSGISSGEGLIWAVRDPIEGREAVKKQGHKTNYVRTIVDPGVEDKRLLAFEAEFAQLLKLMARESNIASTVIRQAWDSDSLRTLVKINPAGATGAHISIIGHITKDELRRRLTQTEMANGFGNRFLWLCVQRSQELPEGGHLNDDDLIELSERLKTVIEHSKKMGEIRKTDKARGLWKDVYSELSKGKSGLLGAVTARGEAQVMRLAMLYARLDQSKMIQRRHLEAGLALWKYAEDSARFIFGDSVGNPLADEILRELRKRPQGLTRTEISSLFANHKRGDELQQALVELAQSGDASFRPESTGGRPHEGWFALGEGAKNAK
jgi:hypothetical protein